MNIGYFDSQHHIAKDEATHCPICHEPVVGEAMDPHRTIYTVNVWGKGIRYAAFARCHFDELVHLSPRQQQELGLAILSERRQIDREPIPEAFTSAW